MFDDNEKDYFLKNFFKREPDTIKSKEDIDFPLELFDSTLQNLTNLFQVDGQIECFKENLKQMRKLVNKFPDIIVSIFKERGIFLFLIELLKVPDNEIQTNSLEITTQLLHGHEDIIKLYVDNEVYPNILDFFFSENVSLIYAASYFFSMSILESPSNFLIIFLNDLLQELIRIYSILDKGDANSRIIFSICQIFYTLFDDELNVDVEVLERVYQNILFGIFERRFYFFFLQFVESILQVTERDDFKTNPAEMEFIQVFYNTDFPLYVSKIVCQCFNEELKCILRKKGFKELNQSLILIAKLFNINRIISSKVECEPKLSMFTEIEQNIFLLRCVNECFSMDHKYEEHGMSFLYEGEEEENEEEEEESTKIDCYLFYDLSINAVRVFISFVKFFKCDAITIISNFKIIGDFTDNPDDHPFAKKSVLTELCLNILECCSDNQFKAYLDSSYTSPLLGTILCNIDPLNKNHLRALNRMLNKMPERSGFSYSLLKNYHHFLVQIQGQIEENNPKEKEIGTCLTMIICQIQKNNEEADGFDEEGKISDDFDEDSE